VANKRHNLKQKKCYSQHHVFALCAGADFFNDTFARGRDEAGEVAAMRQAWPVLREAAFERQHKRDPEKSPMAFWYFEAPAKYRLRYLDERHKNEAAIIEKMRAVGLLPAPKDETKTETL
jgi:hypothetical protein